MRQQLEAYKELLSLAEKTDILVKGDVKLLGEITDIEQNLILKLAHWKKKDSTWYLKLQKRIIKIFLKQKLTFLWRS